MKLKPFNLQKALEGEPLTTRAGWQVKIAGFQNFPKTKEDERLLGWVFHEALDCWVIKSWAIDGRHITTRPCNNNHLDLFML